MNINIFKMTYQVIIKLVSLTELKERALDKAINRYLNKHGELTLGQALFGGCPGCGHACSWDEEKYRCYKCGWDWKDELD